jgi:bifunctional UDP-N-acetylglucosamine pyrophosphorylase/glucosamine-1-phosphate N-acetyltransferase
MSERVDIATVLLAAGQGTRMQSDLAKVLHPILGVPMIVHSVDAARAVGSERVVVVVGHQAGAVEDAVRRHFPDDGVVFALQAEQNGTGHAVQCAKEAVGDAARVLIMNGDVPGIHANTLQALKDMHGEVSSPLAFATTTLQDPAGYGRILRGKSQTPEDVVEHRDATPEQHAIAEINVGMYLVDADFLFDSLSRVGTDNAQGEVYLTDIVSMAAALGEVGALDIPEGLEMWGINDRVQLAEVERAMRARTNESLMRAGVSFAAPETTTIATNASIGKDTTLGRGVRIGPGCRVGEGCRIDEGCVLEETTLGNNVHVKPYCVLLDSAVGDAAQVGPFAHLRPGTRLDASCKVGNFVETKKAHLHEGTKASHLSYLGDCEIGAGSNIGAGTITCNYDGVNKFKTTLGEGVFIGSDTQLVAPVSLGDNAYVGAGTTVTEDVPAGALVISRTPQRNIEGWVAKKKAERDNESD